MITEKSCSRCKEIKPLSGFRKGKDTKLGYQSACIECEKEATKKKRKYNVYKCKDCNEDFRRRSDNKNTDYCAACSHKRRGEKQRGQILEKSRKGDYVKCDNCGEMHYKKRSQLKRGFTKHFCSQSCQGQWSAKYQVRQNFITSADNSGKNNGKYKDGKRIGTNDRHKHLKKKIIERDGEGCLICKNKERLHVHRILPGGLGGKYTLDNSVMLCNEHHEEVHQGYDVWKDKLFQMIEVNEHEHS